MANAKSQMTNGKCNVSQNRSGSPLAEASSFRRVVTSRILRSEDGSFLSRAQRHQLYERSMAGKHGDQGVARPGIKRHRAQQCASPEPPEETRAMDLVVSLRDRAHIADPFMEGLMDD